jgi:type IV pilus assembly protein PilM
MGFLQNLGDKFFSNKFPMVGVDISDTSIELVMLQAGLGKSKIKEIYRLEIEPGLIVNGRISDLSKVAIILQAAFKKGDFKNNSCLLSLPDKETYFLNLSGNDLATQLYSLAQESLPVDLGQCYYDYLMINETEAFFVAAPKDIIRQYLELFKLANLDLQVIDFESACLARALTSQKELQEPTFIIDLGAKSTDIVLADQQGFLDQVNFAIGGYFISEKIAENLKQDFVAAEKNKLEKGTKIEGLNLAEILTEMYQPVFAEIKKMSAENDVKIKKLAKNIILAGGTSRLNGLLEIFKKSLPDYQIEVGNLENKIDFDGKELGVDEILYANVLGLALRGLNTDILNKGINLIKNLSRETGSATGGK